MSTRYFQSTVTGRPLYVGGRSFIFEPVEPMGGSWLGVLAVDDESSANILAAETVAVWEITADKYESLKKKLQSTATSRDFAPSQTPQLPPQPLVASAGVAERQAASTTDAVKSAPAATVPSVTLATTDKSPPVEPLLESVATKRKK